MHIKSNKRNICKVHSAGKKKQKENEETVLKKSGASSALTWTGGGLGVLPALRQRAELMKYLQMGVRSACRDKPDVVYIPRKQVLLFSYCPRAFA